MKEHTASIKILEFSVPRCLCGKKAGASGYNSAIVELLNRFGLTP